MPTTTPERVQLACEVVATLGVPGAVLLVWLEYASAGIAVFVLAVACAAAALAIRLTLAVREDRRRAEGSP